MENVVYTALFGNYEELKEPTVITPGWQYICFTDQPLTSNVWEIRNIELFGSTPQKMARYFKIMEWVDWDKSIWVDASFIIATDLNDWWNKYFSKGFAAAKHPFRDCVFVECLDCIIAQRGDKEQVQAQMKEYKELNVPANAGVIQSGILLRENKPEVIELCERWWAEMQGRSIRDQIAFAKVSLNYTNFISTYQWDYRRERDFIYKHHYNRR